jgi:hypothetical protein
MLQDFVPQQGAPDNSPFSLLSGGFGIVSAGLSLTAAPAEIGSLVGIVGGIASLVTTAVSSSSSSIDLDSIKASTENALSDFFTQNEKVSPWFLGCIQIFSNSSEHRGPQQ